MEYKDAKRHAQQASELLGLSIISRRAAHLFADIILSSTAGIIVFELSGKFVYGNPEWQKITGYSNADLIGKDLVELVHPDDIAATSEAMGYAGNGETEPQYFINRYKLKNGKYQWLIWEPQKKANDPILGVASASRLGGNTIQLNAGFVSEKDIRRGGYEIK